MTKDEQTIANLKKLKSVHNGSYGADIDRAIEALEREPFMNKPCVAHQICHEDKAKILDKIRAEIEKLVFDIGQRGCGQSIKYGLSIALEIIDKYKPKNGEVENDVS